MTRSQISTNEYAARYRVVLMATLPAAAILLAAATMLTRLLIAWPACSPTRN